MARVKQSDINEPIVENLGVSEENTSSLQDSTILTVDILKENKLKLERDLASLDEKFSSIEAQRKKLINEIDDLIIAIERSDLRPYNPIMDFLASNSKKSGV